MTTVRELITFLQSIDNPDTHVFVRNGNNALPITLLPPGNYPYSQINAQRVIVDADAKDQTNVIILD